MCNFNIDAHVYVKKRVLSLILAHLAHGAAEIAAVTLPDTPIIRGRLVVSTYSV